MYECRQKGRAFENCADETVKITCLYDMDIPRPDNFNETYLYEGMWTD